MNGKIEISYPFLFLLAFYFLSPPFVFAYVGPGSGLSLIGALLAAILGVLVAILGFLWYPIRRLLRKYKKSKTKTEEK